MKKYIFIIVQILFLIKFSFGQTNILKPGFGINDIEFGYSTRDDVIKSFGIKCDTILKSYLPPQYENKNHPMPGFEKKDQLLYKSLGISFICDDDGEIISEILLFESFVGQTKNGQLLILDKTTFRDVFGNQNPDSLKVGTTGASLYWRIVLDGIVYYFNKDTTGTYLHPGIGWYVPFNKSLPSLQEQKIKYVQVTHPFSNRYILYSKDSADCNCAYPMYSPVTEKHLNCLKRQPMSSEDFFTYGSNGKPSVKEGFWKEYYPNHQVAKEGNYKNDKQVGFWKYYDKNGMLIKSIDYGINK